jgi:hypothetical protein
MRLWTLLLLLIGALSAEPSFAGDLSTRQMEALSPRVAGARVRQDLLSILRHTGEIRSGMFKELHGVALNSRPIGTDIGGLCRHDVLTVLYGPSEDGPPSRDKALRPVGVEAESAFLIVGSLKQANGRQLTGNETCERLSVDDRRWFSAPNSFHAARGALLLDAAVQAIESGRLKPKPCPDIFDPKQSRCDQVILREARADQISSIKPCTSDEEMACYVLDVGGMTELTIKGHVEDGEITPRSVESVSVKQYVVVT